jgi:DNA-directed RNA polymerase subunit delta
MIELAYEILGESTETVFFFDLVQEIQGRLERTDDEIRDEITQFYSDLNADGRFISPGANVWGIRSKFTIDEIDENAQGGNLEDNEDIISRLSAKFVDKDGFDGDVEELNIDIDEVDPDTLDAEDEGGSTMYDSGVVDDADAVGEPTNDEVVLEDDALSNLTIIAEDALNDDSFD